MTVSELKFALSKLETGYDDCEVILTDVEANHYSPLGSIKTGGVRDGSNKLNMGQICFDFYGFDGNCFVSQKDWENYKKTSNIVVVLFPKD